MSNFFRYARLFKGQKDSLSFHRWINLVCGILATVEWKKLYDEERHTFVNSGSKAPILNNHLYSALMLKLKGPAADYAASRRDLQGDGISLLHALRSSYRTILTPSELVAMNTKFNNFTRPGDMPIETYVAKMEMMHQEIMDNGGFSSKELLKQNFILGLGPEFTTIINHQNKGTLPVEWTPLDLHSLIPIAKKYLQSILSTRARNKIYKETHKPPTSSSSSQSTGKPTTSTKYSDQTKDRMKRIHTAIYHRSFKISDFTNEVGSGCCVFHGTKDHTFQECMAIKRTIAKSNQNHSSSTQTPVASQSSSKPIQPSAKVASTSSEPVPQSVLSQIEAIDFAALQGEADNNNHSSDIFSPYLTLSSTTISLDESPKGTYNRFKFILDMWGVSPHV